ncbi:hypothetical protein EJ05DRAFT_496052 [Pseudovirgaria hyperparasitica]|uniref:Uncharacterized protein n=1 Tax=Pseudovirgaria hyperparasitica TaxID=470096 RepID=A0A6A6WM42_9PEZI|nr:uncharacterized protein EJ05DRAFT_496052 [Pseudovirgaria hyperparasitica]KAF2763223.1 hypothetical protein EJ05DRAFT_496052 [Pseudovirgaria hyperparasitica]
MSYWWQKYRGLSSKHRLLLGVGVIGYAGLGLVFSDAIEEKFGMVPTEQDKEKLKMMVPRVVRVDRDRDGDEITSPQRKE